MRGRSGYMKGWFCTLRKSICYHHINDFKTKSDILIAFESVDIMLSVHLGFVQGVTSLVRQLHLAPHRNS